MKFALYCSGNASRIIKFYEKYRFDDYPLEFIFYDGTSNEIFESLVELDSNLDVIHYQNINCHTGKVLSQDISDIILESLVSYDVSRMFCFGSKILKAPLIAAYDKKIINFHPSLLPAFPGLNAIDQAIEYGVRLLGNTAHYIDDGVDTGEIISQNVIHIDNYDGYEDVLSLQIDMLKEIWDDILIGQN